MTPTPRTRLLGAALLAGLLCAPIFSGVKEGMIECANLIYAGSRTSRCFSDEFLRQIERESTIRTARRFVSVKLSSKELFEYPFVMMTGEGAFSLPAAERENLRSYLSRGGFLLASAGCSNKDWDRSFRREMRAVFNEEVEGETPSLRRISFDHPVFHTLREIKSLPLSHGGNGYLEGIEYNGKLVVVYSKEGLNDTAHTSGCCCCGGNEIRNSAQMNMNILAYVLLH